MSKRKLLLPLHMWCKVATGVVDAVQPARIWPSGETVMRKQKFRCKKCGHEFVVEVLEDHERERDPHRGSPVRCPKCQNMDLYEL